MVVGFKLLVQSVPITTNVVIIPPRRGILDTTLCDKNVLLFLKMTKDPKKIHIPINAYKGRKLCPDYTQYLYVINQETHKFYNKL
jgi:hypothetical protein